MDDVGEEEAKVEPANVLMDMSMILDAKETLIRNKTVWCQHVVRILNLLIFSFK